MEFICTVNHRLVRTLWTRPIAALLSCRCSSGIYCNLFALCKGPFGSKSFGQCRWGRGAVGLPLASYSCTSATLQARSVLWGQALLCLCPCHQASTSSLFFVLMCKTIKCPPPFFFFEHLFLRGLPSLMRDRDSKDGNINSRDIWERWDSSEVQP